MKHPKHQDLIKAHANGAAIEYYNPVENLWLSAFDPYWDESTHYRVAPPSPDKEQIRMLTEEVEELRLLNSYVIKELEQKLALSKKYADKLYADLTDTNQLFAKSRIAARDYAESYNRLNERYLKMCSQVASLKFNAASLKFNASLDDNRDAIVTTLRAELLREKEKSAALSRAIQRATTPRQ